MPQNRWLKTVISGFKIAEKLGATQTGIYKLKKIGKKSPGVPEEIESLEHEIIVTLEKFNEKTMGVNNRKAEAVVLTYYSDLLKDAEVGDRIEINGKNYRVVKVANIGELNVLLSFDVRR